jgi:gamma-glutamyl-gamma-aminobutyrate hydrolase PuuD
MPDRGRTGLDVSDDLDPQRRRSALIGLSPRLLRAVPQELGFRGKTLQYLEQSVAHWVMSHGALTVMVPSFVRGGMVLDLPVDAADFADRLDGLVLQGGADIHPSCYGREPIAPLQSTDLVRDLFELDLLRAFMAAGKPVLGICRGMQLINVALGGTLHQDLVSSGAASDPHDRPGVEEDHRHGLEFEPDGWLSGIYGGCVRAEVNSIHHQGVEALGEGLQVEARAGDGVVEAIRSGRHAFLVGVQWHPEFHDSRFPDLLSSGPLMQAFLAAVDRARSNAASRTD